MQNDGHIAFVTTGQVGNLVIFQIPGIFRTKQVAPAVGQAGQSLQELGVAALLSSRETFTFIGDVSWSFIC